MSSSCVYCGTWIPTTTAFAPPQACEQCEAVRAQFGEEVFEWFLRLAEHKAEEAVDRHNRYNEHETKREW